MKRPFFTIMLILMSSYFLLIRLNTRWVLIILVASVISAGLCVVFRRYSSVVKMAAVTMLSIAFASTIILLYNSLVVLPQAELVDKSADIVATVIDEPQYYQNYTLATLKTSYVNGEKRVIKLRLYLENDYDIKGLQVINAKVTFNKIDEEYKESSNADKVFISAKLLSVDSNYEYSKNPFITAPYKCRAYIKSTVMRYFGRDTAGMILGVMLGDRSQITDDNYANLKTCGVMHLLAVSGMHLSVICHTLLLVLHRFGIKRRHSVFALLPVVIIVMAVTGFTPSVVRAGVSYIIYLCGFLVADKSDPLNTLGLSAIMMVSVNPYLINSLSFRLSCLAMLGLLVIAPAISSYVFQKIRFTGRANRFICGSIEVFLASIAAGIATLPITMIYFGGVSLISPFVNMLISAAAMIFLVISIVFMLCTLMPILLFILPAFTFVINTISNYIIAVCRLFAGPSFSYVSCSAEIYKIWLVFCILVALLALIFFKGRIKLKQISSVTLAVLFCVTVLGMIFNNNFASVKLLTSNNANMTILQNKAITIVSLYGTSDDLEKVVYNNITDNNISAIDILLLPQASNAQECYNKLSQNLEIKNVLLPEGDIYSDSRDDIARTKVPVISLSENQNGSYGDVDIRSYETEFGAVYYIHTNDTNLVISSSDGEIFEQPVDILITTAAYSTFTPKNDAVTFITSAKEKGILAADKIYAAGFRKVYGVNGKCDFYIDRKLGVIFIR